MQGLWSFLLTSFNAVSKKLQNVNTTISEVISLFNGLIKVVSDTREEFDQYEEKALSISTIQEYKTLRQRRRNQNLQPGENRDNSIQLSGRDNFRVNTFNVILDRTLTELTRRREAYQKIYSKFSLITDMKHLSNEELREKSIILSQYYTQDLEENLGNEMVFFKAYCTEKKILNYSPLELLKMLRQDNLQISYPNVEIALRMFVSIPISNCSAERSFSVLKRVKNYLRSSLSENKLNALALLTIESDLFLSIDCEDIIREFAAEKSRRKEL
ncbi:PREDICTED: uncharacterized protein LOC108365266 [Rhagoletis zephyria]|uniref:uncharacterized protein LOC108365266 n=1 Tax=Rhagoletis zephyria TaxID=28612 RepID=UPI000811748C|nr:PREDICTED: uncharacterized protein LOC108365266 [Rhagoletis zephyria]